MKKIGFLMMALLAMLALLAAGCGGSQEAPKKAETEKVLRVGTEPAFAPFEFQKEGSDEFTLFFQGPDDALIWILFVLLARSLVIK